MAATLLRVLLASVVTLPLVVARLRVARVRPFDVTPVRSGTNVSGHSLPPVFSAADVEKDAHTVCRVQAGGTAGEGAVGAATIVLNVERNKRTLFFERGKEVTAGMTSVFCVGALSDAERANCLTSQGRTVVKASECAPCPCRQMDSIGFPSQFAYIEELTGGVRRACARPWTWPSSTYNVLIVGMGGGAMAMNILGSCAQSDVRVEGIEYDQRVIDLSQHYFGVPASSERLVVERADALDAVKARAREGRTYDAILIDCFAVGGETPEHCRNGEFITTLRTILGKKGFVGHHLWQFDYENAEVASQYSAALTDYRHKFLAVQVQPLPTQVNVVVYAVLDRTVLA